MSFSESDSSSDSETEIPVEDRCGTCQKRAHDFTREEALNCVPPRDVLTFGQYVIDHRYREALYQKYPFFTTEEVVGSYLGHNPHFPSQEDWITQQEESEEESEYDF